MRVALVVVAVTACDALAPSFPPACPSGQIQCGLDGPCFDPSTRSCCDYFGGEVCAPYQTCLTTDLTCQSDAWFLVVCTLSATSPKYRGTYGAQGPNESLVLHEYELQFENGCDIVRSTGPLFGNATVTFDGTAHAAMWAAKATDAGPLTFSGDQTLGLVTIAVRSFIDPGFLADVTDANGTHAVTFALTK
jgi:hypothetical protein